MEQIKKIDDFLNETSVCYVSTVERDRPRCRPIGFHLVRNDKIYFIISNHKDVYHQLRNNPKIEIVASKDQNWMRYFGEAVFEEGDSFISQLLSSVPELRDRYGADAEESLAVFHLENAVCEFRKMTLLLDRFVLDVSDKDKTETIIHRLQMANPKTLKQHIEEGRFIVYYQPQYLLSTRQMCGVEALVRLTDGDKIVPPDEFVPALEEARIIDTLDFFVFDHICAKISAWKEEGRKVVPVSSNFSRHTMATDGFVNRLKEVVVRHRIPKELIKLEITETAEAENRELFLRMVAKLKEEGFGIAIDDFGVMGANMRLLTEIDYDLLKIDKSVIDTVHTKKETKIMTGALIGACHHVGSKVLAEGVESDEQVQALLDAKCDAVQGYYFCKPVPEREFEQLIA